MTDNQAELYRQPAPGSGGVFGRRIGRKLRKGQSALAIDRLPSLSIDLTRPVTLEGLFPDLSELRIEIGFGGGEHLAHRAAMMPAAGFLGCEPFRNGVVKLLEQVETRALTNVRVHPGDAALLLDRIPDAALSGADILYPDPWPKRRQRKRRFISDDTLARLARVMRPGAPLRFATDIDDYAGWTLVRVMRSGAFAWTPRSADDWRQPWPDWPSTRYETKALREGRRPVYLTFNRTSATAEGITSRYEP